MFGAIFVNGFLSGLSLIVAIGAQNAFVLRQGLSRAHVLPVVLACALSDALLIVGGVAGADRLIEAAPWLGPVMLYAGAAFLFAYGFGRLRAAAGGESSLAPAAHASTAPSAAKVLFTCLALTWANPHVYLDTVFLLGALSAQHSPHEWVFAAGAVAASFTFFFALGYGARGLAPLFARQRAWRFFELAIGLLMWAIAFGLLLQGSGYG